MKRSVRFRRGTRLLGVSVSRRWGPYLRPPPRATRTGEIAPELGIHRRGAALPGNFGDVELLPELLDERVFSRQVVRYGAASLIGDLDDSLARIDQLCRWQRPRILADVRGFQQRFGQVDRIVRPRSDRQRVAMQAEPLHHRRPVAL